MQILTDTVSSEINRSGKDKYCVSPLGVSRAAKLIEKESAVETAGGWGEGGATDQQAEFRLQWRQMVMPTAPPRQGTMPLQRPLEMVGMRDFHCSLAVKTLSFPSTGHGRNPWSGT